MGPLRLVIGLTLVLLFSTPALAEHFTGTYATQGTGDAATLSLTEDPAGHVTGTLRTGPNEWRLEGMHQEGEIAGTAAEGRVQALFEAEFDGKQLHLTLTEMSEQGQPDHARDRFFTMRRTNKSSGKPPNAHEKAQKGRE
jgi:hypothetical protein